MVHFRINVSSPYRYSNNYNDTEDFIGHVQFQVLIGILTIADVFSHVVVSVPFQVLIGILTIL